MEAATASAILFLGFHGATTLGLTSYPALEAGIAITHEQAPTFALDFKLKAPISRAESLSVEVAGRWTPWRF